MAQDYREVAKPIINDPFQEPKKHYLIQRTEPPQEIDGRRPATWHRLPMKEELEKDPKRKVIAERLVLANEIRERVARWRAAGRPVTSDVTKQLLNYWASDQRERQLFFCQREAAETVIFLRDARRDFLQSLSIPSDDPGPDGIAKGSTGFSRYATKMATGSGKTTVMGMLAAWSILNKVASPHDPRYSDTVLVVCPNITIRERLAELEPQRGEGSIYRQRDLVPSDMMTDLRRGKVVVTNWHVLEPRDLNSVGGVSAKVVRRGVESDRALVERIVGSATGGPVLVMNDEAHHAYRRRIAEPEEDAEALGAEAEEEEDEREATIWIDGLDRLQKVRGIQFAVDLSATPFYLKYSGREPGRPFPWIVSDFGLVDAIESGIVKIPQLAISDTTGEEEPPYFNIWKWILKTKLTTAEKGGARSRNTKPEAILKYAQQPILQLAGQWRETFREWQAEAKQGLRKPVPPVFIIVCNDTRLSKVVHEWISGKSEAGEVWEEFTNKPEREVTLRIDTHVGEDLQGDTSAVKEDRRIRFALQTIGRTSWPGGAYPEGWLELAKDLDLDPSIPPGRDVRCIVSVSMLTEGWDANTVTHIVGLRPFQSQLLCEQVVGRGLRRTQYDDLTVEEVAKIYGVPFEIIPMKAAPGKTRTPPPKTNHVHALPERAGMAMTVPRVEGYITRVRNRIAVDWNSAPTLPLDPTRIPTRVRLKGLALTEDGRRSLYAPGDDEDVSLDEWRKHIRVQQVEYQLAKALTKRLAASPDLQIPPHALFPQALAVVKRFVKDKVTVGHGTDLRDLLLDPYNSQFLELVSQSIRPDIAAGEAVELPRYERNRKPGSTAEVDFWTSKKVVATKRSHLNANVCDTRLWEQIATEYLEVEDPVLCYARNVNLGLAIPYRGVNGEKHDYYPDFIVRLRGPNGGEGTLILEIKGFDVLSAMKEEAAERWVAAVNADGQHGRWAYRIVRDPTKVPEALAEASRGFDEAIIPSASRATKS